MIMKILLFIVLLAASAEDIRKKEISAPVLALCIVLSGAAIAQGLLGGESILHLAVLPLLPGAVLTLLSLLTRQGIGLGDGLLLLFMGPCMGFSGTVLGLMTALFAGSIFSGILLAIRKATRKTRIPFVPFVALGMGAMILEKI